MGDTVKRDATNPAHYKDLSPEPIDVIEGWGLGFHIGNAVKYLARAGKKGDALEDLRKARWYLDREISRLESSAPNKWCLARDPHRHVTCGLPARHDGNHKSGYLEWTDSPCDYPGGCPLPAAHETVRDDDALVAEVIRVGGGF